MAHDAWTNEPRETVALDVNGLEPQITLDGLLLLKVPVVAFPSDLLAAAREILGEGSGDDELEYLAAKLRRVAREHSLRMFLSSRMK